MKIRIASSLALAAALTLGATGCSMFAPQGTLVPYAPSDGVDVNVEGIDVRNILLVADETGENFNVVFSAYNRTGAKQDLVINFVGKNGDNAVAEFTVPTGNTLFGNPDSEQTPVLVTVPGLSAGATISAYFQKAGSPEVEHNVPVLDGTLADYRPYVLPANFAEKQNSETFTEDQEADQSHIDNDQ